MSLDIDLMRIERVSIWETNVTHNLGAMAKEAGIYELVWRPDECEIKYARQLIEPLEKAIAEMKAEPERFKKHNPKNEWGSMDYDGFLTWLEKYLEACEEYPDAEIESNR